MRRELLKNIAEFEVRKDQNDLEVLSDLKEKMERSDYLEFKSYLAIRSHFEAEPKKPKKEDSRENHPSFANLMKGK